MRSLHSFFLAGLSLFLFGCNANFITNSASFNFQREVSGSFPDEPPSKPQTFDNKTMPVYILVGSFSTGEKSYVRSLFSDDDAVWIGTTEGILKIATHTGEAVQTVTLKDGLLSPYIFAINKGDNNVYWFGTNNGGLSRYDGNALKTYLPSDGLADFWVYGTDFAKDGTIWIATWNGVSHFDGKVFKNYNTTDGLADRWVYALAVDSNGGVWFGTEGGVSRLRPDGQWKSWTHQDGLGASNKNALPKSENTGFGTLLKSEAEDYKHNHDLSVMGPNGKETYNENYVFAMAIDTAGNKWFGTWGGGASRFDGTTWKNFTTDDGLAGNIVYDVTIDPNDGAIWFGTNHGASRYDGQTWTNLTRQNGLSNENIYAIAIDRNQRVWLGEKGGVDVFSAFSTLGRQKPQDLRHGTANMNEQKHPER